MSWMLLLILASGQEYMIGFDRFSSCDQARQGLLETVEDSLAVCRPVVEGEAV